MYRDDNDDEFKHNHYRALRAKIAQRTITIAIIGTLVGVGGYYSGRSAAKQRTLSLVSAFTSIEDPTYCAIPTEIVSNSNINYVIAEGKNLYESLIENKIKYCSILDEYYTEHAIDLIKIVYSGIIKEEVTPRSLIDNGVDRVYESQDGYVIEQGKVYRYYPGITTRILPLINNKSLEEYLQEENINYEQIIDSEIIHSKPYSEIIDNNLIVDINPNSTREDNNYYGTVRLNKR